jgi:hypothetical protein
VQEYARRVQIDGAGERLGGAPAQQRTDLVGCVRAVQIRRGAVAPRGARGGRVVAGSVTVTEQVLQYDPQAVGQVGRREVRAPFFDALREYADAHVGQFHALPVARGASVFNSKTLGDMADFYGRNIFMAETSASAGGPSR